MTDEDGDDNASADTANRGRIPNYATERRDLLKTTGAGVLGITSFRHTTGRVSAEHQLIEDWNNLYAIRGRLEDEGEDYILAADLDADTPGYDDHVANPTGGWEPIDDAGSDNSWSLYGDGHSISDLIIDRPDESSVGLFGEVANGEIEDISIRDADIIGGDSVGTLIGTGENCTVVDSDTTGSISGDSSVGGLIGSMLIGEITDSYSEQSVTGSSSVGGLVGRSDNLSISNSYATGSVSSDGNAGGLIGSDEGSTITDSYAKGSVEGSGSTGGLLGFSIETDINQSFATGTVNGESLTGGPLAQLRSFP
ncbi:GLUG motif-containing protein [Halovalidus salilacus]|uniref:GLUG motif-containing protein n=1 Tax=Halovalidus salilacus TaxID=3075124 RepID=UPI0036190503